MRMTNAIEKNKAYQEAKNTSILNNAKVASFSAEAGQGFDPDEVLGELKSKVFVYYVSNIVYLDTLYCFKPQLLEIVNNSDKLNSVMYEVFKPGTYVTEIS